MNESRYFKLKEGVILLCILKLSSTECVKLCFEITHLNDLKAQENFGVKIVLHSQLFKAYVKTNFSLKFTQQFSRPIKFMFVTMVSLRLQLIRT